MTMRNKILGLFSCLLFGLLLPVLPAAAADAVAVPVDVEGDAGVIGLYASEKLVDQLELSAGESGVFSVEVPEVGAEGKYTVKQTSGTDETVYEVRVYAEIVGDSAQAQVIVFKDGRSEKTDACRFVNEEPTADKPDRVVKQVRTVKEPKVPGNGLFGRLSPKTGLISFAGVFVLAGMILLIVAVKLRRRHMACGE